jgi:hypothetical protein
LSFSARSFSVRAKSRRVSMASLPMSISSLYYP